MKSTEPEGDEPVTDAVQVVLEPIPSEDVLQKR
jgi:hypothetical protein